MQPVDSKYELHLCVEKEPANAVELLAAQTELSRQRIKKIMQQGAVWITRRGNTERLRRAKRPLKKDDEIHLYYSSKVLEEEPESPLLIADKGGYSVWYKPYGMLCQGSKWGDHCTLNRWVDLHGFTDRTSTIIHRLDRATTGLVILVHKKSVAKQFSSLFQQRAIVKRYRAWVEGIFPAHPEMLTIDTPVDDRPAISHVKRVRVISEVGLSLVEIHIETGRKHQIRQHLSSCGWPVVGDRLYGAKNTWFDLQLSAVYLSFVCPIDNSVVEFSLTGELLLGETDLSTSASQGP